MFKGTKQNNPVEDVKIVIFVKMQNSLGITFFSFQRWITAQRWLLISSCFSCSYLHWSLQSFLDVHAFAHYGLVQFALKRQQIHVGLRLWDQFPDLLRGEKNMTFKSAPHHGGNVSQRLRGQISSRIYNLNFTKWLKQISCPP